MGSDVEACYHKPYAVDGKTDRRRAGGWRWARWGAAVGAALGHQYDVSEERRNAAPRRPSSSSSALSAPMGHVAKADGRVTEREIEAARTVMRCAAAWMLEQVRSAIALFTAGKQPGFDLGHRKWRSCELPVTDPSLRYCACSWRSSCALRWPAVTWRAPRAPVWSGRATVLGVRPAAVRAHGGGIRAAVTRAPRWLALRSRWIRAPPGVPHAGSGCPPSSDEELTRPIAG